MSDKMSTAARKLSDNENDLVWGAAAIGVVIDRTPSQVYHLISTGALDGVVGKLAHKTIVGSRRGLLNLPFRKSG
jgi:hypothetical protein